MPENVEVSEKTPAQIVPDKPEDVGLGLAEFLDEKPSPDEPDGDVKTSEEEVKEPDKEYDKTSHSEEAKATEDPVKAEDKPSTEPVKEPAKEEAKPVEEEKPTVNYESDDNPYKKRHRDTSNWATDLNKKVIDQDREIKILSKKVEGTYDEERDNPKETSEEIEEKAASRGRARASRESAVTQWGEETVSKDLDRFYEVFGQDQFMQGSVMSADQPVVEAIQGSCTSQYTIRLIQEET